MLRTIVSVPRPNVRPVREWWEINARPGGNDTRYDSTADLIASYRPGADSPYSRYHFSQKQPSSLMIGPTIRGLIKGGLIGIGVGLLAVGACKCLSPMLAAATVETLQKFAFGGIALAGAGLGIGSKRFDARTAADCGTFIDGQLTTQLRADGKPHLVFIPDSRRYYSSARDVVDQPDELVDVAQHATAPVTSSPNGTPWWLAYESGKNAMDQPCARRMRPVPHEPCPAGTPRGADGQPL